MKTPVGRALKTAQQATGRAVNTVGQPVAPAAGADIANSVFGLGQ
jgi:hypothetical protein